MAATAITITKLAKQTAAAIPSTAAVDATAGALVAWDSNDSKLLIILENASADTAKTATIKNGSGLQGMNDLAVSLAASAKLGIVLDSGKFKQVSGDNKGKLVITGTDANVKVAAVQLP